MKKTNETQGKYTVAPRDVRLSVRLTAEDMARLDRLAKSMSPYAPLSFGKVVSAALVIAEDVSSKLNALENLSKRAKQRQ